MMITIERPGQFYVHRNDRRILVPKDWGLAAR
jgi:uncharacterized membrane protein